MRDRRLRALALLLPLVLVAAACGDDDEGGTDTTAPSEDTGTTTGGTAPGGQACSEAEAPEDAPSIVIGAQDFGESAILAEVYAQCLEAAGYDVEVQELGGFREIELAAFESGDINFAPEYAASMLEALNGQAGEATSDVAETVGLLNERLAERGLVALEPTEAVDTNGFAVTEETAEELGLRAISDLAGHEDLVLGAPADCETNAFCLPGLLAVYGVDLSAGFTALETGAIPDALDAGAIDIGVIFTTSPLPGERGWVMLEDDMGMLAADNVVPVVTTEVAEIEGLAALVDAVSATLTTEVLVELNRRFEVDVEDPDDIAAAFLEEAGLL